MLSHISVIPKHTHWNMSRHFRKLPQYVVKCPLQKKAKQKRVWAHLEVNCTYQEYYSIHSHAQAIKDTRQGRKSKSPDSENYVGSIHLS